MLQQPDVPARPRLIATDLDGTLLRSDGTLSDRTVATVTACEAAGATLVIATGRPPRWISAIGERLGHQGLAVCANGALVYDLETESVVSSTRIEVDAAAEIVRRVRRAWPAAVFAVEAVDHLGLEPAWPLNFEPPPGTRFGDAAELVTVPPVKILARLEGHPVEAAMASTAADLAGLAEVTWSGGKHLLEMSAPGVTKGAALAALADRLGVGAVEAIAFGDMPNDLDMLRWAGRGLAVANAHELVRAAADAVVGANDDDGVAAELEAVFGLG
ncbi:MAG: HAD family hydrolase [Acidimicrobiia bacterium]